MNYTVRWEFDDLHGEIDVNCKFGAEATAYDLRKVFIIMVEGREYYRMWRTKVIDPQGNIISEIYNDKAIQD